MLSIYVLVALSLSGLTSCTAQQGEQKRRLRGSQGCVEHNQLWHRGAGGGGYAGGQPTTIYRMLSDLTSYHQVQEVPDSSFAPEENEIFTAAATNEAEAQGRHARRRWRKPLKLRIQRRETKVPGIATEEGHQDINIRAAGRGSKKEFRAYMRQLLNYAASIGGGRSKDRKVRHSESTHLVGKPAMNSNAAASSDADALTEAHHEEKDPGRATSTPRVSARSVGYSAAAQAAPSTDTSACAFEVDSDNVEKDMGQQREANEDRHRGGAFALQPLQQAASKLEPTEEATAAAAAITSKKTAGGTEVSAEDPKGKTSNVADITARSRQEEEAQARHHAESAVKALVLSGISSVYVLDPQMDDAKGGESEDAREDATDGRASGKGLKLNVSAQRYVSPADACPRDSAEPEVNSGRSRGRGGESSEDRKTASDINLQVQRLMHALFKGKSTLLFTLEKPTDGSDGVTPAASEGVEEHYEGGTPSFAAYRTKSCSEDSTVSQKNGGPLNDVNQGDSPATEEAAGATPQVSNTDEREQKKRPGGRVLSGDNFAGEKDLPQHRTSENQLLLLHPPAPSASAYGPRTTSTSRPLLLPGQPIRTYYLPQTHPAATSSSTSPLGGFPSHQLPVTVQVGVARAAYIKPPVAQRVPSLVGGEDD